MANSNIEFTLGARSDTSAAVGQAIADVQRYKAELDKLKASTTGTAAEQAKIGELTLGLAKSQGTLRDVVRQSASEHEKLAASLKNVADSMANQAGAAAPLLRTLTGISIAAGLAATAAIALGAASIAAATSIGNYQEAIELAADRTGLTEREIGGLKVAASNVGRSFDSIAPSLNIFSRNLGQAREGSDQARAAFAKVGVSITDLQSLSTGEILKRVAADIDATGSAADRSAKLMALFGRGGADQLAILRQSMEETQTEADRLNINLTDAQKKVAKEADVAADRFRNAWTGAINRVEAALAPLGTKLLQWATNPAGKPGTGNASVVTGAAGWSATMLTWIASMQPPATIGTGPVQGPVLPKPAETFTQEALRLAAEAQLSEERFQKAAADALEALTGQADALERRFAIGNLTTDELLSQLETLRKQTDTLQQQEKVAARIAAIYKAHPDLLPGPRQPGIPPDRMEARLGGFENLQPINPRSPQQRDPGLIDPTALSKQQQQLQNDLQSLVSTLRDDLANALTGAILGTQDLDQAFQQMFNDLLGSLIKTGIHALIPLPFAAGGTLGMPHAQSGLMVSGIRGSDSTMVAMQQGETIVSTRDTERWSRFLDAWEAGNRGQSGPPATSGNRNGVNVSMPISISGVAMSPRALEDLVSDQLLPAIISKLNSGAVRRWR